MIWACISLFILLVLVLATVRWELASMRWASMSLEERAVTSHDLSGCWLTCGPPFFWALTSKRPVDNDPDRLRECGVCGLCMVLPCPGSYTRRRNRGTDSFRKDKDAKDVTHYASDSHAVQSCFICKCKLCG